jgi:hypothetical protein
MQHPSGRLVPTIHLAHKASNPATQTNAAALARPTHYPSLIVSIMWIVTSLSSVASTRMCACGWRCAATTTHLPARLRRRRGHRKDRCCHNLNGHLLHIGVMLIRHFLPCACHDCNECNALKDQPNKCITCCAEPGITTRSHGSWQSINGSFDRPQEKAAVGIPFSSYIVARCVTPTAVTCNATYLPLKRNSHGQPCIHHVAGQTMQSIYRNSIGSLGPQHLS